MYKLRAAKSVKLLENISDVLRIDRGGSQLLHLCRSHSIYTIGRQWQKVTDYSYLFMANDYVETVRESQKR